MFEIVVTATLLAQSLTIHLPHRYPDRAACTRALVFEVMPNVVPRPGVKLKIECRPGWEI
jgi:hypothetical protein